MPANYVYGVITPFGTTTLTAEELYARGEYEKAFVMNLYSAKSGDAVSQLNVGYAYEFGEGVGKNLTEAVRWYKKAADQNEPISQYNLAKCYFDGDGVEENFKEGLRYLIDSANNNYPNAQHDLAVILDNNNRQQDAFEWYKKAAEAGYLPAQHNLALCYSNGEGTQQNIDKAIYWFQKAADQGSTEALFALTDLID